MWAFIKGRMTGTKQAGKTESNMAMDDRERTKGIACGEINEDSKWVRSKGIACR